ncbi:unnamed protein product [Rhizophagus irregularis]|nr:unnamed protein product [Rhizophagus irregularis]
MTIPETDEENARAEMKVILKTMPTEINPRFSPSYKQINDWLAALHKHRRARLLYVERGKKSRRVKGAISLFKRNDDRVKDYDKTEVLNILKDTRYHSPEDSETDKEQPDAYQFSPKRLGYSRIFSTDGAINEGRNYDDESYCITSRHPKNAPEWAYKTQNTPVDTDFSGPETPAENRESQSQTDDNTQTEHND